MYNLLVPETHGCFVEDCSDPMHMDTEDDHSCAGSSGNLEHNLCNEKAEYDCEEQSEEPQADNVFDSVVGDEKCQPEGTLKLFEYLVAITCVV